MSYVESVQRAIDYIEEHLDEELDLSSIAEEAYTSVAQLYRVFYALTGHPVKDYIRKRRISVAANHLRYSKRKVEELAWDSGFESYHSFAKVFKKIVGLTPATYRNAELFFSFEPIRLYEQITYKEDKEQAELFPDVKVIRFLPDKMYTYLHISKHEEGMENEAFRTVFEKLGVSETARNNKVRIFGYNVDLQDEDGKPRYGYRVLIEAAEECMVNSTLTEEPFTGGLYAVRKVAALSPKTIQDGWDRLLSEWLPKSTFDIGTHQYIEEFIAYNRKVTRMNLYLPVQRSLHNEPIEVVELTESKAFFYRGYGAEAQKVAERRLINWYERGAGGNWQAGGGTYYISYHYGFEETEEYWWENGILKAEPGAPVLDGLEVKGMGAGSYACCVTKTYGLLTGVLDKIHRWIATNGNYWLDEERQWFAEYHMFEGMNVERDSVVKVYIPILPVVSTQG
ncbi:AraC family transcriptional regulator [Paenibacillus hemerocallicola]|uniref:AraC family transcriptional regulator n=1 Tax=Paenibacillus hemerocallicola TaxID=1172614 RepID=A0A5C4SYF5_9BACL|nr:helix-turn-helix domain-containing protein [Paenibacillus hemerocallicola]TNJ61023.1 AraC family transcriptional regulator [Paenibacillus hemerocallicola]